MIDSFPLVSVYIPSYNYGKFLSQAIESVLKQTFDSWELILIDEGSSDNSLEVMNLYKGDPKVRLYETDHIGLPGVANFAINNSNGQYIIRLDADDVFDDNALLVMSNYLEKNADTALVFPDFFLMDEQGFVYAQQRIQPIYHSNHMLDAPPNGACTMIRKDVLEDIGGYRSDLGAQDGFDLWSKIRQNYKSANVNIPLFYYRRHGNNLTGDKSFILNARREIKKDATIANINKFKPVVAIILCREFYDFIPHLWKQKIANRTLLDIAIERCIKSSLFDSIIVSSDTLEVRDYLKRYNDKRITFEKRNSESTIRSRPVAQTIKELVKKYDPYFLGVSVLSILQAPFIKTKTMEEVVYTLIFNDSDSSILVKEVESPLFQKTAHGLMQINYKGFMKSDFDTLYLETDTCIAVKNSVVKKGSVTGSKIVSTIAPNDEIFYIRSEQDMIISEALYGAND